MFQNPSLRIAVTEECNLACQYCPKHGDNYFLKNPKLLDLKSFRKILSIAYKTGIKSFTLTGGEPLLKPELTFPLATFINSFKDINYLKINTNGILIKKYIKDIEESNFSEIKVDLNTLKKETFKYITQREDKTQEVLEGIKLLKSLKIPIRIQIVVGEFNVNEISKLLDFCERERLDVKIFDLTYYENSKASEPNFWQKNYIPLESFLKNDYLNWKTQNAIGGFGHSMKTFKTKTGSKILIRDSNISAHYASFCQTCSFYPCQDGVCNITLSIDGRLKICRNDGYDISLFKKAGVLKSEKEIEKNFRDILNLFNKSKTKNRGLGEINLPKNHL